MVISNSTDRFNGALAALAIKVPCVAATTVNITLSAEQSIDGVVTSAGDRVLVKDQSDPIENGIYEVSTSDWQRTPDWDGNRDVTERTIIVVGRSGVQSNVMYQQDSTGTIRVGTDAVTFSVFFDPTTQSLEEVTQIGNFTSRPIFIGETSSAETDVDGRGQFWVDDAAPNVPMFTGDTSVDIDLSAELFFAGEFRKVIAVDETANENLSGANITSGAGTNKPIGYGTIEDDATSFGNGTQTPFQQANAGENIRHTDGTATTYDIYAETSQQQIDLPDGSWWDITHDGAGALTIGTGTGVTLFWWDGAGLTPPSGDRTLARGGRCRVRKISNTRYEIYGIGLT